MGITRVAVAGLLAVCLQAGAVTAQEYLIAVAAAEPQPGLYAMKSDGTDRRLVQAGGLTLLRPDSWSPDGGTLLYLSASQEFSVGKPLPMHFPLVAVDTNGRQPRLVADFPVTPMFGWAADSRFVFVVSGFEDSDPPPPPGKEWFPKVAVYVIDVQSGARTRLTDLGEVRGVSWSPDGLTLACAWRAPGDRSTTVVAVNRDGSGTRRLTGVPAGSVNPRWSPDGRSIAVFTPLRPAASASPAKLQSLEGDVHVVDVASGRTTRVSGSVRGDVRWTQDGSRVLVDDAGSNAVLVTADGQSRTVLGKVELDPVLSPDGRHVLYRTRPPGTAIWAIRIDDGTRTKIAEGVRSFAPSPALSSQALERIGTLPRADTLAPALSAPVRPAVDRAGVPPFPEAPGAVRAGGEVQPPAKLTHVEPVYPPGAREARVQGVVMIEVLVDETGAVRNARVVRSIPQLDDAALVAVRQWTFEPTRVQGTPVAVVLTVMVRFTLPGAPGYVRMLAQ